MEKVNKVFTYLFWTAIITVLGALAFYLLSCSMFQKRFYTEEGDQTSLKVMYELCIKGEDSTKGKGGNTLHCKDWQQAITPQGKFNGFKSCIEWKRSHNEWEEAKKFNCKKLFGIK